MAQLFHRSTNTISRVSIFGAVFFLAGLTWVFARLDRSGYATGEGVVRAQPIPFSHEHHTAGLGIDCRYCHTSVEESSFAGIPPTATCMNCHKLIWSDSPMLEPVRASLASDRSLRWQRVYDLPDFVYFNHAIHVAKGIGCESCHGRVDRMPLLYRAQPLQMEWCLDCHRHPERHVRPKSAVFRLGWEPPPGTGGLQAALAEEYGLRRVTDCGACHR
jgi:hypothetical protein